MSAKQKQGMAALEEYLQQKYVEYFEDTDQYVNKVELLSNKLTDLLLTNSTSRKYIIYEGKTHYLLNKKSLPQEIQDGLIGGDSDKTEDFSKLIDVYGITTDLKVYYVNTLDGTQYGNMNVEDVNPDLYMPKVNSDSAMNEVIREALKEAGVEIDETKGITIDNVSKISKLTIDGTKNKVTNIEALSELLNLQELTLKNLTLDNLTGIETLGMLNYIYFNNCKISDYSKMANVLKLKYLYFYFPTTMTEIEANSQITNFGNGMANATKINGLEYLRIYGEVDTISLYGGPEFGWSRPLDWGFGAVPASGTSNLSDISSLSLLPDNIKSSVIELYLNNHKINNVESLSGFNNIQNLLLMANPNLKSLVGLENKTKLLYLAVQQANLLGSDGKLRKDLGISDFNGLRGCSSLLYLISYNNTNLQNIEGLLTLKSLKILRLDNCNVLSTNGLQGEDDNGLDSMTYLNLQNNVNLGRVKDISLCNNIVELYLANNINMIEEDALLLESIILKCGSNYSIPGKYTLGFQSITSQDIEDSNFSDSDLANFKNKTNIKRLRLKNCTSLSDSKINEVLSTMTGIKYLSLEGTKNLVNISFVNHMKLVQLDIRNTSVVNLTELNDESSENLNSLYLSSTNINEYQTLIKNVFNSGASSAVDDYDRWVGQAGYQGQGLILKNSNITVKVPSTVTKFGIGSHCAAVTFDLSACNLITSVYTGGLDGTIILPSSLKTIYKEVGLGTYDFSRCTELTSIYFITAGDNTWCSENLGTLPLKNSLVSLELTRTGLTNLDFLLNKKFENITTLSVHGYGTHNKTLGLVDVSGISGLTNLKTLSLYYIGINRLEGISGLENLTSVNVFCDDYLTDVSELQYCTGLTSLRLDNNQISSVSFLGNLTALTTANLSNNSFSQIPDLSNLTSLDTLNISGCTNITDLGFLESLIKNGTTSLRTLNLQNCSGIEGISSTTGFDNNNLIDKLRKAGCNSITTTGTRL